MTEEQEAELRYEAGMYQSLYENAKARIEALEAALMTEWAARDNRIEALEAEVARLNSIIKEQNK